jgi:hypothetical protein
VNTADYGLEPPFPAPPERLPPPPRAVAWNRRTYWCRVGLLCGLLLAPNAVLAIGWFSGQDLRDLEARGQSTIGRYADKTSSSGRSGTSYRIYWAYEVNGRNYRTYGSASANEFHAATRDSSYPITYLPDHPETSTPGRPGPQLRVHNETTVWIAAAIAVVMVVWAPCFGWVLQRERSLAREGEPAIGRITELGYTSRRNNGTIYYWARHEYFTPADDVCGTWHYVPKYLWDQLRNGMRITLLFDPANPKRHLPLYAFKYVYILDQDDSEDASSDFSPVESEQNAG